VGGCRTARARGQIGRAVTALLAWAYVTLFRAADSIICVSLFSVVELRFA
jgi:hypothetical protein